MRVTKDRLAVARAVHEQTMMRVVCHRHGINASVVHSSKIDLEAIIAAIPEPEPQIKYGCHCDIENTVSGEPDDCVFDNGDVEDCVYAVKLQREGKGKLACEYWKPITPPAEPPDDSPATLPAGGWVVMDGDGKHYRTWRDGFPAWTSEAGKATRYLRREDAEAVHYEDEGAWLVVPQQSEPLPAPTGPVEYEVHVNGERMAGASGLREDSLREAMHYAAQYADDGEVEVLEVRRIPLVAPTAKGGVE